MNTSKTNGNIIDTIKYDIKKIFDRPEISTVPGLARLPARVSPKKTAACFLEGRREIDGAEGLWRIGNSLYDLEIFAKSHPGGAEWLRLTKGTDITELFETHHLTEKPRNLLPKFYVRDTMTPRSVPWTFKSDGFYNKFKKRVVEALKDVDFHHSSATTNLITDSLAIVTFALSLMSVLAHSYVIAIFASICLTWTVIAAHNYFHARDNFRMYYFDLCLLSSKNWRITHVMSHHMYTNTLWDFEIYAVEPFLQWYPHKGKSYLGSVISKVISPVIWSLVFIHEGIKRYYSVFYEYRVLEFRDIVPFILPITMFLVASQTIIALKLWLTIIIISSALFSLIGLNAAHHHPDIFHDGDIYRDDMDWGLLELDAVRCRKVIDNSTFLVLTNFGSHTLHHLLPTVDHYYLKLCVPALLQTCKEFGIDLKKWSPLEMIRGQFEQLSRMEAKKNSI